MSEDSKTKTGSLIKQSSEDLTNSSDHFVETEKSSKDFFTNTESLTETTGYINLDDFPNSPLDQFLETEKSSENYETKNVRFAEIENKNEHDETHNESLIKQRRPTGYVRPITSINSPSAQLLEIETSSKDYEIKNESLLNQRRPTGYLPPEVLPHAPSVRFMETEQSFDDYENHNESAIKQRRPTGYSRPPESPNSPSADYPAENESLLNQRSPEVVPDSPSVRFAEPEKSCEDFESTNESLIKQRRPTGYNRPEISYDSNDNETNRESKFKQRRATTPEANNVTFIKSGKIFEDSEYQAKSLVKQRRPTGYIQQAEELYDLEKQVSFQLDTENNENRVQYNEALQQRRPTGFIRKEEINKQVNFALNEKHESDKKKDNEKLRQRRPTGLIKNTLTDSEFDNNLWQELEKDVAQDFSRNFEAEFAKIRHSYELNEADFLELKDELQKSPSADVVKQPLGFGKSIEDDWENFEKLKNQVVIKPLQSPETEIKITFSDNDLANTISILKDKKLEEELQAKPRKSKVTFDFKTEEHVIPARKSHYDAEDNTDNEEDEKVVPPQPIKRVSNINYNNELPTTIKTPTSITLFGSQANSEEDSWSLIRKHRNLTSDWQNSSPESSQTLSSPKPTYRNPMAQLAIQRAKEVRGDMDGFKAGSINNRKPEATKRQKQKLFYLNKDDNFEGTEA